MGKELISLVVPVYNEEDTIDLFLTAMRPLVADLNYDFEFIFINDGSTDQTLPVLIAARSTDVRIKIVDLARNFGKELAMAAGFAAATGAAVIPMDVDLQDPPELIADFLTKWQEGYDVVIGVRRSRQSDSAFKRRSANLFYQAFNYLCGRRLVPNAGDYRLMNRQSLDALNSLPERVRFTKGLYAWVGFRQAMVYYDRPPRSAGSSKWNMWKLWNFALDGITSFSTLPLRIWSYIGMAVALIGFCYAGYLVLRTMVYGVDMPGYASMMVAILSIGGMILVSLGVIGEYLGRIFEETKNRPLYVVRSYFGLDKPKAYPQGSCQGAQISQGSCQGAQASQTSQSCQCPHCGKDL